MVRCVSPKHVIYMIVFNPRETTYMATIKQWISLIVNKRKHMKFTEKAEIVLVGTRLDKLKKNKESEKQKILDSLSSESRAVTIHDCYFVDSLAADDDPIQKMKSFLLKLIITTKSEFFDEIIPARFIALECKILAIKENMPERMYINWPDFESTAVKDCGLDSSQLLDALYFLQKTGVAFYFKDLLSKEPFLATKIFLYIDDPLLLVQFH